MHVDRMRVKAIKAAERDAGQVESDLAELRGLVRVTLKPRLALYAYGEGRGNGACEFHRGVIAGREARG